ncbi:hypothetical protein K503DRAFT_805857 [Rhizopogon vinicolor AM-OR11-026]|uniref:Uncharacterized protein n=1 Tax=Rhizopogon vinicolor AM-OR11-026 TaxID=1314800 RepID=A0A1B7MGH2_9AGAM|nr:hypothetical protein K503DRAFT_805857 [Rhizopogon vinicolor AM-OR11-026]
MQIPRFSNDKHGVSDQIALKLPAGDGPTPKDHRQLMEKSSSRVRRLTRSMSQVMEDDISMIMRRHAIRGYGLASAKHNTQVLQEDPCSDTTLSELWAWIHRAFSSHRRTSMTVERTPAPRFSRTCMLPGVKTTQI